jgi:uncharacterized damage-inducible protein DinB
MENKNNTGTFEIIPALLKEMDQEIVTTRKMLALVPFDKLDWQPHPKSMKMQTLAVHIAELPSWVKMALTTEELDFAAVPYEPTQVADSAALLQLLEQSYEAGRASLAAATEADLPGSWVLRTGDQIHAKMTKYETIRHSFQQTTHHRAQLGVYLRLLNIPIPGSYGPSADEMNF